MAEVHYVLVLYTQKYLDECLATIEEFHAKNFRPEFSKNIVLVDNSLSEKCFYESSNYVLINGDNADREFSGLRVGVDFIKENIDLNSSDIFVLANDTFHRNYGDEYLDGFRSFDIEQRLSRENAIIGYMDCYPESVSFLDFELKCWIRSSFFVTNLRVLTEAMPLKFPVLKSEIFGDSCDQFFSQDSCLSEKYIGFLKSWLFGEENENEAFTQRWHSMERLTPQNLSNFQQKAFSILSEHFLSAYALSKGVALESINQIPCLRSVKRQG